MAGETSRANANVQSLFSNRFADEWVGFLVIGAVIVLGVAVVEAGFLRQWLTPVGEIHFVLPQNGVDGLAVGNDIDVMGVHAGEIRQLNLNPEGRLYAIGTIEPQFEQFIRQDSTATIRRTLIVTGASFIDITRGRGLPLDWGYAVLMAKAAPNPADMLIKMLGDLHAQLVPTMANAQAITLEIRGILTDLHEGRGTAGALLNSNETINRANALISSLTNTVNRMQPIEAQLHAILASADKSVTKAGPALNATLKNARIATAQMPDVMIEAQAMAESLRELANQLKSLWLLGGSGANANNSAMLPARAVQP
ncbi:MCE family protein [Formicincola oecophyllae]|uniref:MCE family protein n=1 Tax=Formicincola oecophyllae TaxID=2558361 RepID=A0A4Y6U785_9PROT|nr:MlaD family protein [Formicincola oecophyllae]QDH12890.1 MCE family protein [Formicincola oecophyllae]